MFKTTHAVQTMAEPEEIWAFVKDFSKWRFWIPGLKLVQLQGAMVNGVQGQFFLDDDRVHEILIHRYDLGLLEIHILQRFGVRIHLTVDVSHTPTGSKIKMEGELLGAMSVFHFFGWRRTLKTSIAPMTRQLGIVGQEVRRR
jgi:hypothetical protein